LFNFELTATGTGIHHSFALIVTSLLSDMMDNYSESDEAFARRLQAQEMGNFPGHQNNNADAQTPLVVSP